MSKNKYKLSQLDLKNINSICVYCWGRIGDAFLRTDNSAARTFNPVTTKYNIVPFSRITKLKLSSIIATAKNIRFLRRYKFDLSIDLYGGGSSPVISYLVAAKIRLAFDHKAILRSSNNLLAPYPQNITHCSKFLGSMLTPLEINLTQIGTDVLYNCDKQSRAQIKHLFTDTNTHFIGVNLGASTLDKAWPIQDTIELLSILHIKTNITPVIFFNPGQEELSETLISSYPHKCISLKGFNFELEAAALEQCDLFITGDTSLMHLATGVKTPVFAFFLKTRPENVLPDLNPFHACMIEDDEKEVINGYRPIKDRISVSVALTEFIQFTKNRLNWKYI